jgi:hypothetical protein
VARGIAGCMSTLPCRYKVAITMPLTSAFVCVIETRIGTVSPGSAPCLGSSVVAVIVCADEDVVLLRVSLVWGLRFAGDDSASTTWKLCVLVAVVLE